MAVRIQVLSFLLLEFLSWGRSINHWIWVSICATCWSSMSPDQFFPASDFPFILHYDTAAAAQGLDALISDASVKLVELPNSSMLYQCENPYIP